MRRTRVADGIEGQVERQEVLVGRGGVGEGQADEPGALVSNLVAAQRQMSEAAARKHTVRVRGASRAAVESGFLFRCYSRRVCGDHFVVDVVRQGIGLDGESPGT